MIIDFNEKKKEREARESIARGRIPLSVSHLGVVTGVLQTEDTEFSARMQRIRASLDKINKMMNELKGVDT